MLEFSILYDGRIFCSLAVIFEVMVFYFSAACCVKQKLKCLVTASKQAAAHQSKSSGAVAASKQAVSHQCDHYYRQLLRQSQQCSCSCVATNRRSKQAAVLAKDTPATSSKQAMSDDDVVAPWTQQEPAAHGLGLLAKAARGWGYLGKNSWEEERGQTHHPHSFLEAVEINPCCTVSSQENEKDDLVRQTTTNLPQNSDNDKKNDEEEDESKALKAVAEPIQGTSRQDRLQTIMGIFCMNLPEINKCGICKYFVQDALLLPGDQEGWTACETCMRLALARNNFICPLTGTPNISPDELRPNLKLWKDAENFAEGFFEAFEQFKV